MYIYASLDACYDYKINPAMSWKGIIWIDISGFINLGSDEILSYFHHTDYAVIWRDIIMIGNGKEIHISYQFQIVI